MKGHGETQIGRRRIVLRKFVVELYAQGLKHSLPLLVVKTLSAAQTSSPSTNPYCGVKGS